MRYFCTYFDSNFVPRALALHHSLVEHCGDFCLYALCLDDVALERVLAARLDNVVPVTLAEVERFEPMLLPTKAARTRVEYYFTCGPSFIRYVLALAPEIGLLTYLDADLYFFSSPEPLLAMLGESSVGLIEHRFHPRLIKRLRFGRFNVGWLSFRRDAYGEAALEWWSRRCIEWCFDRVEEGRYADQKYLDELPRRFDGVRVLDHAGANVALWNHANYLFSKRDGKVWVDDLPLVFFHFAGMKEVAPWLIASNLGRSFRPNRVLRRDVFGTYIDTLHAVSPHALRTVTLRDHLRREGASGSLATRLKAMCVAIGGVVVGSYLIRVRGRIL